MGKEIFYYYLKFILVFSGAYMILGSDVKFIESVGLILIACNNFINLKLLILK